MTEPASTPDVRGLWQSQQGDGRVMSVDEVRRRARRFERMIGRRNLRECVAAVLVVSAFGWGAWKDPSSTVRTGAVLVMAAAVFIVHHLRRWGAAAAMPVDMALTASAQFHQRQLERQRDLLRNVWTWYVLPMLPGQIVLQIGVALAHPDRLWFAVTTVIVTLALAVVIGELNRRGATHIQARIDALEKDL